VLDGKFCGVRHTVARPKRKNAAAAYLRDLV
jgi:hypothetical protein